MSAGERQLLAVPLPSPTPPRAAPRREVVRDEGPSSAIDVAMGVTLGAGLALGIAAIPVTLDYAAKRDAYLEERLDDERYDDAKTMRTWSTVTIVGAIALTTIGAGGLIANHLAWDTASARIMVQPRLAGGDLRVTW